MEFPSSLTVVEFAIISGRTLVTSATGSFVTAGDVPLGTAAVVRGASVVATVVDWEESFTKMGVCVAS